MQTLNLKIDDNFFPHFKAMIDSLVKDHKVEIVDEDYDYEKSVPESVVVSSIFPYKFRPSYYFEDEAYRVLVHSGYTTIYKIDKDKILILEIFKWQER